MDKMSESEKRIAHINAYGKGSIGCDRFEADIMIECSIEGEERILDLFLTQDQAEDLTKSLVDRIFQNISKEK